MCWEKLMVYFLLASWLISCLITDPYVMSTIFAMHHSAGLLPKNNTINSTITPKKSTIFHLFRTCCQFFLFNFGGVSLSSPLRKNCVVTSSITSCLRPQISLFVALTFWQIKIIEIVSHNEDEFGIHDNDDVLRPKFKQDSIQLCEN